MKRTDECDDVISVLALVLRIVQMTHEIQKYGDTSLGRSAARVARVRVRTEPRLGGEQDALGHGRRRRAQGGEREERGDGPGVGAAAPAAPAPARDAGARGKPGESAAPRAKRPHSWLLWASTASTSASTASTSSSSVSSHGPARSLSAGICLCRASDGSSELGRARGRAREEVLHLP